MPDDQRQDELRAVFLEGFRVGVIEGFSAAAQRLVNQLEGVNPDRPEDYYQEAIKKPTVLAATDKDIAIALAHISEGKPNA